MEIADPYELKSPIPWYREIRGDQWRVLFGAWAVWALDAIDYLSITFVLTDIAAAFKVSLGTTSLLLLATYGVRWLGGLLFGGLSDRIGRKVPLLICLLWFSLGAAFTGLAWSFASLVAVRLLLGFGMAPGFSLGATMVAESWPERHRALGIGILDTGWGVGAIGSSLIYAFVYPHFGWRGLFFVGIIPSILLGLFIIFYLQESPAWAKRQKQSRAAEEFPAITLFKRHPRRVAYLAVLMLVLHFGSWPFQGLFPTYLKTLSFSTQTISWITTTAAIGQISGFFCCGPIAESMGRRYGLAFMLFMGTVFTATLVAFVRDFIVAEVTGFLAAFFLVGASGIWATILTENLPADVRASGVGFLYNFGAMGGGLAPFVVLASMKTFDISLSEGIAIFTAIATALAIALIFGLRETRGVALSTLEKPAFIPDPLDFKT